MKDAGLQASALVTKLGELIERDSQSYGAVMNAYKLPNETTAQATTTLESRLFGESKMKILRTIGKHLGLLRELAGLRLRGGIPQDAVPVAEAVLPPSSAPVVASRAPSIKIP